MTSPPVAPTPPAPPQSPGPSREQIATVVAIIATVLASLLLVAIANRGGVTTMPTATQQGSGEIFRQASDEPGENAFTASVSTSAASAPHLRATPSAEASASAAPSSSASTPGSSVEVQSSLASTPGLYGGTRNLSTCDSSQLVTYLRENPSKASAWVDALNRDPTLTWSRGSRVTVDQIGAYVSELTPVLLRSDTRVTNNGFVGGRPDPYQAVLQAGTAVLIDSYGVPRVRCACGNPLDRPVPVSTTPTYTGTGWTGFSPTTVVVVQPPPTVITVITLVDVNTGEPFGRPAGTAGTSDGPAPTPGAQPSPSATSTPTASPSPSPSPSATPSPSARGEVGDVAGTYSVTIQLTGSSDCLVGTGQATLTVTGQERSITLTFADFGGAGQGQAVPFTGTYDPSDRSFSATVTAGGASAKFEGHFDGSGGITGTGSNTTPPPCSATVTGHRR